jgi:hypothetical protein
MDPLLIHHKEGRNATTRGGHQLVTSPIVRPYSSRPCTVTMTSFPTTIWEVNFLAVQTGADGSGQLVHLVTVQYPGALFSDPVKQRLVELISFIWQEKDFYV